MRKSILYILLLAAALLAPLQGRDVGKLLPVELVHLYREGEAVVIATDTDAAGTGVTVEAAFENLQATTAGIVFLDTADYLLVDESAMTDVTALKNHLKPSVKVCKVVSDVDLKETAAYLSIHKPQARLKDYRNGVDLQELAVENGQIKLEEK